MALDDLIDALPEDPGPLPLDLSEAEPLELDVEGLLDAEAAKVNGTEFTQEELDRVLQMCLDDIPKAEEYVRPWRLARIAAYKAYHCVPYGNERQGLSRYIEPTVYNTVESIMPQLIEIFCSGDKFIEILGRKAEDDEGAETMQELVDWQIQQKNDGFRFFYTTLKEALLFPNAYYETGWNKVVEPQFAESMTLQEFSELKDSPDYEFYSFEREQELRTVPPDVMPTGGQGLVEIAPAEPYAVTTGLRSVRYGKVKENSPQVVAFHPGEFLLGQGEVSIPDAQFAAREFKKPFSYLKAREFGPDNPSGVYFGLDEIVLTGGGDGQEQQDEKRQQAWTRDVQHTEADKPTEAHPDKGRAQVTVTRCWPMVDLKGDGSGERLLVEIANRKTLVRCEKLPFRHGEVPVADVVSCIDPHQHGGVAPAQILDQLQKLLTALHRQIVDNAAFANSGFWEYSDDAEVDLNDLLNLRPRGAIKVKGQVGLGLKRHAPEYFGDKALLLIQHLDDRTEKRTGVTAYNQGLDANSLNKTARGIQAIMAQAQLKIKLIARIMADGFKPLIRHFVSMNQQFLDKKQDIRLTNKAITYDPSVMNFEYDLRTSVGIGTGNKIQQLQDSQYVLELLLKNAQFFSSMPVPGPMGQPQPLLKPDGIFNAVEDVLLALGKRSAERYFNKPAPLQLAQNTAGDLTGGEPTPQGAAPEGML